MKQRKALILYASMTNNTEKIAETLESVFDAYNGSASATQKSWQRSKKNYTLTIMM